MSRPRKSAVDAAIAADKAFAVRAPILGFVFVTVLSLLSWRLIQIQYIQHEKYLSVVRQEHIDDEVLPARRGQIYDRQNSLIVANRVEETIVVDRNKITDIGNCARALAHAEGVKAIDIQRSYAPAEIRQKYVERLGRLLAEPLGLQHWEVIRKITQSDKVEIILAKDVDESDGARMKDMLRAERITGVLFRDSHKRTYPFGNRLTHVLGYIAETGNAGVELSMNDYLEGTDGHRVFETDRKGREIAAYRGDAVEPKHGNHVRLTIEMGLQEIVEDVLDEVGNDADEIYVPQLRAEKVSVILMEPGTGAILAVANRPHFDLETRKGNWRNFAVCDQYEPGSTFKVVTLSGALESGKVTPNVRIRIAATGEIEEAGITVRDDHPYAELTVEGILIKSSNIGAWRLARQLGQQKFYEMGVRLGFGEQPGTGLPGESRGQFFSPKHWSKSSLSRKAMGYEVGATPLQMVSALSTIVNEGVRYESRIVDAVFDERGLVVEARKPKILNESTISPATASAMRTALVKVCLPGGTGMQAVPPGFTCGGKTGTSQKFDPKRGGYMDGRYVVSFMGFVPAENPKFIGIVVVDDPKVSKVKLYGGTVAAPIFRRIAERALDYLKVEPTEPT
ncbi:MAG: penicillin-binding protein 2, partial [Verrucomicrobia bacterium]|nr:penicillin-binding protein 2 [Verrucomicrobiota bacterium]